MSKQNEAGIRWIEEQVYSIAAELGIQLNCPLGWDVSDPLIIRMAVTVAGRREIKELWKPDIADGHGENNRATQEVCSKLRNHLRNFLEVFARPIARIDFQRWVRRV